MNISIPVFVIVSGLLITAQTAIGQTSQPTIKQDGKRVWIDKVPVLQWGQSGENTFCGALAAVMRITEDRPHYARLMGDSSLAFRVRWWKYTGEKAGESKWSPSNPVGEMSPWDDAAFASAGWSYRYVVHIGEKYDMDQHRAEVVASIDAGKPVLAYMSNLDVSLIYGYENAGEQFLVRDYYKGETESLQSLHANKGLLLFLEKPVDRASEKDRAIAAIKGALRDWKSEPLDMNNGHYHMGERAWEKWINDLKRAEEFSEADQKQLFFVGWWTFECMDDARQSATAYLYSIAPLFDEKTSAHLSAAAKAYFKLTSANMKALYQEKKAFLGPWSKKSIADWTPEVRANEIELLQHAQACDSEAMAELTKAIELIEHP